MLILYLVCDVLCDTTQQQHNTQYTTTQQHNTHRYQQWIRNCYSIRYTLFPFARTSFVACYQRVPSNNDDINSYTSQYFPIKNFQVVETAQVQFSIDSAQFEVLANVDTQCSALASLLRTGNNNCVDVQMDISVYTQRSKTG